MPDKIDIAELEDALRTEFDSRTDMEHDTIINAARAYIDLVKNQPCSAVGNEYCWKHDRLGHECHTPPTGEKK